MARFSAGGGNRGMFIVSEKRQRGFMERRTIRNVAIIAHVDHGKTTLVDQLLRQSGQFRDGELSGECILDSNDLERERGITILSKNCAIDYTDCNGDRYHVNIVDTPGHADFSGEVERVLSMADGVLLLVDAFEGVMPQTRYVLGKALEASLDPIVVINKMDRPGRRAHRVHEEMFDLLVELGADDGALDFPTLYASGKHGWATADEAAADDPPASGDVHELFDAIIRHVPVPDFDRAAPLQAQIMTLDHSAYVGRIGIGRVFAGQLAAGSDVAVIDRSGGTVTRRVSELFVFDKLGRRKVEVVDTGDLFAVVGIDPIDIGDTLADPAHPAALPAVRIDEPTLHMTFRINDGPFSGREGRYVTNRQLRDRLGRELQSNVALRVEDRGDAFDVSGRGLLHLGILLENMRREGYELCVGKPAVIFHVGANGERLEPFERLVVEVPTAQVGPVMQLVGERGAEMVHMDTITDMTKLAFIITARGLIGLRGRLLSATQGAAVVHHRFERYGALGGELPRRQTGVLIATERGTVTLHALDSLADRGVMFVEPGEEVYGGQIVGEHCRANDLPANVAKKKALTNVRSSTKEATVTLKAPRKLTLEAALEYIEEDELVEITPAAIRLRKTLLKEGERRRSARGKSR